MEDEPGLDIDLNDARHAYYLYRALHDATCPSCGYSTDKSFETHSVKFGLGLYCPECDFGMSYYECQGIQSLAGTVLKVRLDALHRIRHALGHLGAAIGQSTGMADIPRS